MLKISLITATYNSAATLADTIHSVQRQTYAHIEHLIQDGGSQDNTLSIAEAHSHLRVVSEPDEGLYDARNRGIARARGEVIGILNSDDFYVHDQVVEKVMRIFQQYPAILAIYGDLQYVDEHDTNKVIRHWKAGESTLRAWRLGWMPPHPAFFVRRELYERYGTFNTTLRSAADYELMLRFCYKHRAPTAYLPEVLVKMRAGGMSNASLKHRLLANREDSRAWELNDLRRPLLLPLLKPLRKVPQWLRR